MDHSRCYTVKMISEAAVELMSCFLLLVFACGCGQEALQRISSGPKAVEWKGLELFMFS